MHENGPHVVSLVDGQQTNMNVAHLLSQIRFLHGEVDRLEEQLNTVRASALERVKESEHQFERVIEQKNSQLNEWRNKTGFLKDDADLPKRCAALEKQLALANSEKSVMATEKSDLLAKVRRLESQMKRKKSEFNDAIKSFAEEGCGHQEQLAKLSTALKASREQNEALMKQMQETIDERGSKNTEINVNAETATTFSSAATQTSPLPQKETRTAECQVDTAFCSESSEHVSVYALREALKGKAAECDGFRAQLEDLQAVYEDTLRALADSKRSLAEESEGRKLISDDAERLLIQVKSLQKEASAQASAERDLAERLRYAEGQRQVFCAQAMNAERERSELEAQLRQYEKDMEHLASSKNYSNQQLSVLAGENENLRAEIQKLLLRESQLSFSLKAKEGEMREILEAYQNAARESETTLENQRFLERELDNVRATLVSKEDSMTFLQDQLNGLHKREQQLILDLQSFEYENEQLHRKLIQSDGCTELSEAKCRELQQLLLFRDHTIEEMHQSLAELGKQIVVRDNESMLLRNRCDLLESDIAQLRSVSSSEAARNRDLEEANARLVTRDVLSTFHKDYESVSKELESVNAQLLAFKTNNGILVERLHAEEEKRKSLDLELSRTRATLAAAKESKERLERIVLDQTRALSTLSQ